MATIFALVIIAAWLPAVAAVRGGDAVAPLYNGRRGAIDGRRSGP